MKRIRIAGKDGAYYYGDDGQSYQTMGHYDPAIGDWVWANGQYIYGHSSAGGGDVITGGGAIPVAYRTHDVWGGYDRFVDFSEYKSNIFVEAFVNDGSRAYMIGNDDAYDLVSGEKIGTITQGLYDAEIDNDGNLLVMTLGGYSFGDYKKVTIKNYALTDGLRSESRQGISDVCKGTYTKINDVHKLLYDANLQYKSVYSHDYTKTVRSHDYNYRDVVYGGYEYRYESDGPIKIYKNCELIESIYLSSCIGDIKDKALAYVNEVDKPSAACFTYPPKVEKPEPRITGLGVTPKYGYINRNGDYHIIAYRVAQVLFFPWMHYEAIIDSLHDTVHYDHIDMHEMYYLAPINYKGTLYDSDRDRSITTTVQCLGVAANVAYYETIEITRDGVRVLASSKSITINDTLTHYSDGTHPGFGNITTGENIINYFGDFNAYCIYGKYKDETYYKSSYTCGQGWTEEHEYNGGYDNAFVLPFTDILKKYPTYTAAELKEKNIVLRINKDEQLSVIKIWLDYENGAYATIDDQNKTLSLYYADKLIYNGATDDKVFPASELLETKCAICQVSGGYLLIMDSWNNNTLFISDGNMTKLNDYGLSSNYRARWCNNIETIKANFIKITDDINAAENGG